MGYNLSKQITFPVLTYDDIRTNKHLADTGDIILFSGNGAFSCKIQFASLSIYSHVGILVRIDPKKQDDMFPNNKTFSKKTNNKRGYNKDGLYLFHSINGKIRNIFDVLTGKEKDGVQLNPLCTILKCCTADVHIRKLCVDKEKRKNLNADKPASEIWKFMNENSHKNYELDPLELVKAAFIFMDSPDDNNDSYFCSELVAAVYKRVGILPENVNASEYIPKDFGLMCDRSSGFNLYKFFYGSNEGSSQPSIEITGSTLEETKRLKLI